MESSPLSFETLLTYHNKEASEELTYLTIIFSVIFGILGYVGSAKRIEPQVRIVIIIVFSIFMYTFTSAFFNSLKIHDALHAEIRNYVETNPKDFINEKKSALYICLMSEMKPHNSFLFILMSLGLGIIVNIGLLTLGQGKVFSFPNVLKRKRN